jgi:hypothetical protein
MGWAGAFVPKRLGFQGSFQGLMEGFNPHAKSQKPTKVSATGLAAAPSGC